MLVLSGSEFDVTSFPLLHLYSNNSSAFESDAAYINELWEAVGDVIYDLSPRRQQLGFNNGITTYYSSNVTDHDADAVRR